MYRERLRRGANRSSDTQPADTAEARDRFDREQSEPPTVRPFRLLGRTGKRLSWFATRSTDAKPAAASGASAAGEAELVVSANVSDAPAATALESVVHGTEPAAAVSTVPATTAAK